MRSTLIVILTFFIGLTSSMKAHAFLGSELVPLLQLVGGQVQELEKLMEQVKIAESHRKFLLEINDGIEKTVRQIQSIQSIIERAEGLDPQAVRSLADLNELLSRTKSVQGETSELLGLKVEVTNQIITGSALQSDTAYKMGQEMILTGSTLARESETASPGRASQISAATGSAQMLAQGVELQTLSKIAEMQAMTLDLQKSIIERQIQEDKNRKFTYQNILAVQVKSQGRRGMP